MPLVVENGTGIPGADSYNSIAELDVYMLKFGHTDWPIPQLDAQNGTKTALTGAKSQNASVSLSEGENAPTEPDTGENEDTPETPPESVPVTPIVPAEPTGNDPNLMAKEAAARRAAIYIDSAYGTRFTGVPVNPEQGLAWPRKDAVDFYGNVVASDSVPLAIKRAHAEVTLLAFQGVSLAPEASGGPMLKRKKIDVLEWEYDTDTYGQAPIFGWVDKLLFNLLGPASEIGALEIMGVQRA